MTVVFMATDKTREGMNIKIKFDPSALNESLKELHEVFESEYPSSSFESLHDLVRCKIHELCADVVLGDGVATVCADGTCEILYPVKFGGSFENLLLAIRAKKLDGIGHGHPFHG